MADANGTPRRIPASSIKVGDILLYIGEQKPIRRIEPDTRYDRVSTAYSDDEWCVALIGDQGWWVIRGE